MAKIQTALGITADGDFGPQTLAAVKTFQASHGLVADGVVGPKTLAAINSSPNAKGSDTSTTGNSPSSTETGKTGDPQPPETDNGKTPTQNIIDTYTDIYTKLGLTDIKKSYEDTLKQQTDLQNEKNDKIQEINNNPWYSEGVRTGKLRQLDEQYKAKEDTLTHLATLYDSLFKEGVSQAQFLTTKVETATQDAINLAQKKADAIDALTKDNQVVSINGREVLVNKATGKTVADLGATSSSTNPFQDYNAKQSEAQKIDQGKLSAKLAAVTGPDGYVGAENYKAAKAAWVAEGYSGTDFDKIFGGLVNPTHPGDYSQSFLAKPFGQ